MKKMIAALALCLFFSLGARCLAQDKTQPETVGQVPLFPGATCGNVVTLQAIRALIISDIRLTDENKKISIDEMLLMGFEEDYQGVPGLNKVDLAIFDNLRVNDSSVARIRLDDLQFNAILADDYEKSMNAEKFAAILNSIKAGSISVTDLKIPTDLKAPKVSLKKLSAAGLGFNTGILDAYKDKTMPTSVMALACAAVDSMEIEEFESDINEDSFYLGSFKGEKISMLGSGKVRYEDIRLNTKDAYSTLETLAWDQISVPFMVKYPMAASGQLYDNDLFEFGKDKLDVTGLRALNLKVDRRSKGAVSNEEAALDLILNASEDISGSLVITGFKADETAARSSPNIPPAALALLKEPMVFDAKISMPDVAIKRIEAGRENIIFSNASVLFKAREIGEFDLNCTIDLTLDGLDGDLINFNLKDGAKMSITSGKLFDIAAAATEKNVQDLRAGSSGAITIHTDGFPPEDQKSVQAAKDFTEKDGKLTFTLSVRQKDGRPSFINQNDILYLKQFSRGLTIDMDDRKATLTLTHEPTPGWR